MKAFSRWVKRYSFPLIVGTVGAITLANISKLFFGNIISAYVATWTDNILFYGILSYRDIRSRKTHSLTDFIKVFRNLIIEFGPGEYLDSFLIRPLYLATFPLFISNYSLAILLGSFAAEITFFFPVVLSYEARRKMFGD